MTRQWRKELPVAELREAFFQDVDGVLRNRYTRGPALAGEPAGCPNGSGHIIVGFKRKQYLAHRIVWVLHNDTVPDHLDHEDGDGMRNPIDNLRECTQTTNNQNMKVRQKRSKLLKGVTLYKQKGFTYYRARIVVNKREVSLGYFSTEQEAHETYCRAAADRFGAFARNA